MRAQRQLAIVASISFVAGIASGLFMGGRHAHHSDLEPARNKLPRELTKDTPGVGPTPPRSLEPLDPPPGTALAHEATSPLPDMERTAQELWEIINSPGRKGVEQRNRLRELRPEMAEFFIRKFRTGDGKGEGVQWALEMALACGGPRAAEFLEELIKEQNRWRSLATPVLTYGHFTRRPKELPVNATLMNLSQHLAMTGETEDRRLAASILGFAEPSKAIPLLSLMTRTDKIPYVREVAIRELGRIGDASTLDSLRVNRTTLAKEMANLSTPIQSEGEIIIQDPYSFLRVIDDAIEELEERLEGK